MNLYVAVRLVRPFAKGADTITKSSLSILLLAAVILILSSAPGLAEAAIYNLGSLGGTSSIGWGVNDAGQVAGYSQTAGDTAFHAFRYDGIPGSGGVMRDLGTLGGASSFGHAINNSGQVAGDSSRSSGYPVAFRYDGTPGSGGVMRDLGTFNADSTAYGINDAGQVAGSNYVSSNYHAFRYEGTPGSGGVMLDLGTLGGSGSQGNGINNLGHVTGLSVLTGNTVFHAFRYEGTPGSGGVMLDLGTLGGTNSQGRAVNDAGQVAGHSDLTGNTAQHAFRYEGTPGSGGVMLDLGTLGGTESQAYGINNLGQVVGNSQITGNTAQHPFLYTGTPGAGGQMIDLDAWLDANNPTEGDKWTLSIAYDISDTGWITGAGTYDPDGSGGIAAAQRAYLLNVSSLIVPEPAGDFDNDGDVDGRDFLVWQRGESPGPLSSFDLANWQTHFGTGPGLLAATTSVPEPAAGALALLGVSSILLLQRRSPWRPNNFLCAPRYFHTRRQ